MCACATVKLRIGMCPKIDSNSHINYWGEVEQLVSKMLYYKKATTSDLFYLFLFAWKGKQQQSDEEHVMKTSPVAEGNFSE